MTERGRIGGGKVQEEMCIVFRSHSDGMAMKKKLNMADIPHEIIPTPRAFSAGCSISIKIAAEDLKAVREILAYSSEIHTGGIHPIKVKRKWFAFRK